MASRFPLQRADLACPICLSIFRDPVVLKCSHSFCSECLQKYWSTNGRDRNCPLCRSSSLDDPVPSLTLRNLCESFAEEDEGFEAAGEPGEPGELCPLHAETLKLFCRSDQQPICVVCLKSKKHKEHDCCPLDEVLPDVKERLASELSSLREKKNAFDNIRENFEASVFHIQVQARSVERKMREEFEKLHCFLRAEEEVRMEALRREEEAKMEAMRQKIQETTDKIASLSEAIRALEEAAALDGTALLHKCKGTLTRVSSSPAAPAMDPGSLVDVAGHLGSLAFHVWEKMRATVTFSPVTLDPNSAAPWLVLSEDLLGVSDSEHKQRLPDNPERFDPDTGVLGRQRFTAGKHTWQVTVGDNQAWVLGVAKESVVRKEKVSSVLKNGYLALYFYHKMYFAGTSPLTRLAPKKNPRRIRVELDCERGQVCFHDPDHGTHLYTFKHAIAEAVYPYFWVGCQLCPLRLEPSEVSVKAVGF